MVEIGGVPPALAAWERSISTAPGKLVVGVTPVSGGPPLPRG